jgi:hypothetical protein
MSADIAEVLRRVKQARQARVSWREYVNQYGHKAWMSRKDAAGTYDLSSQVGGDVIVEWEPPVGGGSGTIYQGRFRNVTDAKAHVRAHRKQILGARIERLSR